MFWIYRILSYLLLPLGVVLGVLTLASLLAALANVAALLPAFICGATVIYIFSNFIFLQQGILGHRALKPSIYDWIRVNGFVAIFLGSLFVFQSIYFRNNPELNEQIQTQLDAMADQMQTGTIHDLQKVITWALNFMLITGVALMVNILLGFTYLRKFSGIFGK